MIVVEFRGFDGLRIAIDPKTVEALVERDRGTQIVTSNDTHLVDASYPVAAGTIWPDLFR